MTADHCASASIGNVSGSLREGAGNGNGERKQLTYPAEQVAEEVKAALILGGAMLLQRCDNSTVVNAASTVC